MFGKIYSKLEKSFYDAVNFLDEKNIPVKKAVVWLEERGIPAFPAFLISFLFLVFLISFLALLFFSPVVVKLSVLDATTEKPISVYSASFFKVLTEGENFKLGDKIDFKKEGNKYVLSGVGVGGKIYYIISAKNFEKKTGILIIKKPEVELKVFLSRKLSSQSVSFKVIDAETGLPVPKAYFEVLNEKGDVLYSGYTDDEGVAELPSSLFSGENLFLRISSPGYEDYKKTVSFSSLNGAELELAPAPIEEGEKTRVHYKLKNYKDLNEAELSSLSVVATSSDGKEIYDISSIDKKGEAILTIPKGKKVKFLLKKGNDVVSESEEKIFRKEGEVSTTVDPLVLQDLYQFVVKDKVSGKYLQDVMITFFDSAFTKLNVCKTSFGICKLALPKSAKYVSFYREDYLLESITLDQNQGREIEVFLKKATNANSSKVTVVTAGLKNKPVPNAIINLFLLKNGKRYPVGLEVDRSNQFGEFYFVGENKKEYLVVARKDDKEGSRKIVVDQYKKNIFVVFLGERVLKVNVLDEEKKPIKDALVRITSLDGSYERKENTDENGVVLFKDISFSTKYRVLVSFKELSSEAEVDPSLKNEITIILDKKTPFANKKIYIKFDGLYDLKNNRLSSFVVDKTVIARFILYSNEDFDKLSAHVRVGDDDSPDVGPECYYIYSSRGPFSDVFFGLTYNPTPVPGLESLDYRNKGKSGGKNKFVELSFSPGRKQYVFDVLIKVEGVCKDRIGKIHYRAWGEKGNLIYRDPEDSVLGEKKFSESRLPLYAETKVEEIEIKKKAEVCYGGVCLNVFLKVNNERKKKLEAFEGEEYKVVLNFKNLNDKDLSLKINLFSKENIEFKEKEKTIYLPSSGEKEVEFSAFSKESGVASFSVSFRIDKKSYLKEYNLKVLKRRKIYVDFITGKTILVGTKAKIRVEDENKNPITNAALFVYNKDGKQVFSTTTPNKNGIYIIPDSLEVGKYDLKIKAPGYQDYEDEIVVAVGNVLQVPGEIKIFLSKLRKQLTKSIVVKNTFNKEITNLRYSIILKRDNLLSISVSGPQTIQPNTQQHIVLSVSYLGEKNKAYVGYLEVTGLVNGEIPIVSKSRIIITYNKTIDQRCLKIVPEKPKFYVFNKPGSSDSIEFTFENQCGFDLNINFKEDLYFTQKHLKFKYPKITLLANQSTKAKIAVTLEEEVEEKTINGKLSVLTDNFINFLDVSVEILPPNKVLSFYPPRIIIPISPEGTTPYSFFISVKNISKKKIKSLQLSIAPPNEKIHITLTRNAFSNLGKGRVVYTRADLEITSKVNTKVYNFLIVGEATIEGEIEPIKALLPITLIVSPPNCVKVFPKKVTAFSFSKKTITRNVKIVNKCSEPVVVRSISGKFENFSLRANPLPFRLGPGEEKNVSLEISPHKREFTESANFSFVVLFLATRRMKYTDTITLDVRVGKENVSFLEGEPFQQISIPRCDNGELMELYIPIIGDSCSSQFCDAKNTASYIFSLVEEYVAEFQSALANQEETDCALKGYCSSEDLSLDKKEAVLYFSNDILDVDLLRKMLKDQQQVRKVLPLEDVSKFYDTGKTSDGILYLNGSLKGCGKYLVVLDATARINKTTKSFEGINVLVSLRKVHSDFCDAKLGNLPLFLPVDEGLSPREIPTFGGVTVYGKKELKGFAKSFAKKYLGSENRFTNKIGKNRVFFKLENMNEAVLKVNLPKLSGNSSQTTISINEVYSSVLEGDENKDKKIREEIGDLAFKVFTFEDIENISCIQPGKYIKIYFSESFLNKIMNFKLEFPKELPLLYPNSCVDFKVVTKLSDNYYFKLDCPVGDKINDVKIVKITDDEEEEHSIDEKIKLEEKENKLKFCYSLGENYVSLNNKKCKLLLIKGKKEVVSKFKFVLPTFTPIDYLSFLVNAKKEGDYLSLLYWKGKPEQYAALDIYEKLYNSRVASYSGRYLIVPGAVGLDDKALQEKLNSEHLAKRATARLVGGILGGILGFYFRIPSGWGILGSAWNSMFASVNLPLSVLFGVLVGTYNALPYYGNAYLLARKSGAYTGASKPFWYKMMDSIFRDKSDEEVKKILPEVSAFEKYESFVKSLPKTLWNGIKWVFKQIVSGNIINILLKENHSDARKIAYFSSLPINKTNILYLIPNITHSEVKRFSVSSKSNLVVSFLSDSAAGGDLLPVPYEPEEPGPLVPVIGEEHKQIVPYKEPGAIQPYAPKSQDILPYGSQTTTTQATQTTLSKPSGEYYIKSGELYSSKPAGTSVQWKGKYYRVLEDGRLEEMKQLPPGETKPVQPKPPSEPGETGGPSGGQSGGSGGEIGGQPKPTGGEPGETGGGTGKGPAGGTEEPTGGTGGGPGETGGEPKPPSKPGETGGGGNPPESGTGPNQPGGPTEGTGGKPGFFSRLKGGLRKFLDVLHKILKTHFRIKLALYVANLGASLAEKMFAPPTAFSDLLSQNKIVCLSPDGTKYFEKYGIYSGSFTKVLNPTPENPCNYKIKITKSDYPHLLDADKEFRPDIFAYEHPTIIESMRTGKKVQNASKKETK